MSDAEIYYDAVFEADHMREMFGFLDGLRETGVTNMFGAGPYLREEFDIGPGDSARVLGRWMFTYAQRWQVTQETSRRAWAGL